jgi:hypothetical protein
MARGEEKAKRWRIWRPRFSVRTLAIFVTLVCAYFGAWEATKRHGIKQGGGHMLLSIDPIEFGSIASADSPYPLIVAYNESINQRPVTSKNRRRYYVWLFGPEIKLPFESEWK